MTVSPITGFTQQFAKALNAMDASRAGSMDADKTAMVDFDPVEVKDGGFSMLRRRPKEPEGNGSFTIPVKSSIKQNKGIAELFASQGAKNVDVE